MSRIASACTLALALAVASAARAEVAVERNGSGRYKSLRVDSHALSGEVLHWQRVSTHEDDYLNTDGDANGDLRPRAVVLAAGVLQSDPSPVVVWSANSGGDHEVCFSRWTTVEGWSRRAKITRNDVDDVGVDLFLDRRQEVHATWWSDSEVPGVWYSKFSGGQWSNPELLSPPQKDSRNPYFIFAEGALYVVYEDWSLAPVRRVSHLKEWIDP